jgi:hypothetical protein
VKQQPIFFLACMRMPGNNRKRILMSRTFNLEQLRNRARELLRAVQAKDTAAIARAAKALPHVAVSAFRLAHAQTVIARENHFASWPKLKESARKEDEKKKRQMARTALIARVTDEIITRAKADDAAALVAVPPLGKTAGAEIVARISADPDKLELVIDAYIAGLSHPIPKVRFECAHALDSYGHPRAVEPLTALSYDPVPRVRWMALHALSCDACKVKRPVAEKAFARASELALGDPSVQVRRHAAIAVGQLGGAAAADVLTRIAKNDSDEVVRHNARGMLKQLAK